MLRSDERQDRRDELHELSIQMARVKEKTRPWKETIALILAIGAAVVSKHAHGIFASVAEQTFSQLPTVISYALAVVFCVLATIAVLGISGKVQNYLRPRLGTSHAAVVRYAIVLVGDRHRPDPDPAAVPVPVAQLVVGGRPDQRPARGRGPAVAVQHLRRDGPAAVPPVPRRRPHPPAGRCPGWPAGRHRDRDRHHLHPPGHRRDHHVRAQRPGPGGRGRPRPARARGRARPRTTRSRLPPATSRASFSLDIRPPPSEC